MYSLTSRYQQGQQVEELVNKYLQQQGLTIITRNFRSAFGEIDIISQEGTSLVFVEDRYRRNYDFGGPIASVTRHKQKKILRTAECYISKRKWTNKLTKRFDVLGVTGAEKTKFEWIKDAIYYEY